MRFLHTGNGGISYDAKCFDVAATDIEGVVNLAKEIKADLVVVAPDDPLVAGMVDALNEAGFKTFGPRANAAIIEGSKVFSKELMQKYNIPTAEYKVFDNAEEAIDYIKERNEFPTVIKADGLALGKGVIIPENLDDAIAGVKEIMEDKIFGASGNNIVVEEFLTGRRSLFLHLQTVNALSLWYLLWTISVRLTAIRVLIQAEWELFLLTLIIRKTLQRNVWIKYLFLQSML